MNPVDDFSIALGRATGKSIDEISKETGIPRSTVHYRIKHHLEEKIENFIEDLITGCGQDAVDNYKLWVKLPKNWDNLSPIDKNISHQASREVLNAMGLMGGDMSVSVKEVINIKQNIISPVIQKLLEREKIVLIEGVSEDAKETGEET